MKFFTLTLFMTSLNLMHCQTDYFYGQFFLKNYYSDDDIPITTPKSVAVANTRWEKHTIIDGKYCTCLERNQCRPDPFGDTRFVVIRHPYDVWEKNKYYSRPVCVNPQLVCCTPVEYSAKQQPSQWNPWMPRETNDPTKPTLGKPKESCGFFDLKTEPDESGFRFPWSVKVKYQNEEVFQGSLVSKDAVLVDAVSVIRYDVSKLFVEVGTEHGPYHLVRKVKNHRVNPYFMEGQYYDAHALLFLDRQVTLSTKVGTVCLPEKNDNFDGRVCLAAGENKEPDKFVVVPRGECEKALQEKSLGEEFKLHYSFMCAERVNKSKAARNYYGDSLVCLTTSLGFVQVGIFTEAYADQELGDLNVLVDTRRSRGWIGEAMKLGAVNAATSYSVGRS